MNSVIFDKIESSDSILRHPIFNIRPARYALTLVCSKVRHQVDKSVDVISPIQHAWQAGILRFAFTMFQTSGASGLKKTASLIK